MTFGERIRELRKEKRLTLRQLAEMVGVHFTYMSKIENDRLPHTPSLKTIQDLAKSLDADELELLEIAHKVPPSIGEIFKQKEALQFFRRAASTINRPEEWKDLMAYLESKDKGK
jgi:transcriptional regulator with XRE-family HTH domain